MAPPPEALIHAQDKLVMRRRLRGAGRPDPAVRRGDRASTTSTRSPPGSAARSWSRPCAAATTAAAWCWPATSARPGRWSSGYLADGGAGAARGAGGDAARAVRAGGPLAVRSGRGVAGRARPCSATASASTVLAPAPDLSARTWPPRPSSWGCGWPHELGVVGVLAVELFETADGALLVNELAMRPHNSGHWTMDGARHQPVRAAPAGGARLSARRHQRRSRRSR